MKLIIALLTLSITGKNSNVVVVNGQVEDNVPDFTNEQCTTWLEQAAEADADGSGGLSEEEFYNFLTSIESPPSVATYFDNETDFQDLELIYKVAHKALACQCVYLGFGEDCCLGDNAEIPIGVIESGLEEDATSVQMAAAEFRVNVCNSIASSFGETIGTSSTVAAATTDAPETTEAPEETTDAPEGPTETTEAPPAVTTEAPPDETTKAPPDETTEAPPAETTEAPPAETTEAPEETTEAPSEDETTVPSSTGAPPAAMGLELDIVGSAWNISSFEEGSVPEFWDAEEVTSNTDDNNVLGDLIKGFSKLSNQVLTEMMEGVTAEGKRKRGLLRSVASNHQEKRMLRSERQTLQPVKVTDIRKFLYDLMIHLIVKSYTRCLQSFAHINVVSP